MITFRYIHWVQVYLDNAACLEPCILEFLSNQLVGSPLSVLTVWLMERWRIEELACTIVWANHSSVFIVSLGVWEKCQTDFFLLLILDVFLSLFSSFDFDLQIKQTDSRCCVLLAVLWLQMNTSFVCAFASPLLFPINAPYYR